MSIADTNRLEIGEIVALTSSAQDGNAQILLTPRWGVIGRCSRLVAGNAEVLDFIADLMNSCNRSALLYWSQDVADNLSDSAWSKLNKGLKKIPRAIEARVAKD